MTSRERSFPSAKACSTGLEDIIAKNRDRSYRSGRTGDWIKIKCVQSESFTIVDHEQSTSARDNATVFDLSDKPTG